MSHLAALPTASAVQHAWATIRAEQPQLTDRQALERLVLLTTDRQQPRSNAETTAVAALPYTPAGLARVLELGLALLNSERTTHTQETARTGLGAFYTPPELVDGLLRHSLQPQIERALQSHLPTLALARVTVLDPACGGGHFLVAAARLLAVAWQQALHGGGQPGPEAWQRALGAVAGIDIEPLAAQVTAAALLNCAQNDAPPDHHDPPPPCVISAPLLQISDFLDTPPQRRFSLVVGNPPFLSQLQTATVRQKSAQASGHPRGAYTDVAAQFLSAGLQWLAPGGTLALLQPLSTLSTRDAGPVRDFLRQQATIRAVWLGTGKHFADAQVATCALIADLDQHGQPPVQILQGTGFELVTTAELPESGPWSGLLAAHLGVPALALKGRGTLSELAKTTADFRDQYYGLQGHLRDLKPTQQPDASHPPLVLTGHIDPLQCRWGEVPVRFGGQAWQRPVVDLASLAAQSPKLGVWAQARLVPKLVVATQSKVLEAAVDARGDWLNTTPTLSILPKDPADLWLLAAVVLSAPATVWAWQHGAGSAMSVHAVKLSAKQLAQLPLPADRDLWEQAAKVLQAKQLSNPPQRRAALLEASRLMTQAYAIDNPDEIYSFWLKQLGPIKP